MRRLVEHSRFLVLGGVVAALIAVVVAFAAAGLKLAKLIMQLIHGDAAVSLGLLQTVDVILIGAALLITAVGLYQLFVGKVELPEGIGGYDFDTLKQKLASVVVLVMAVNFVEQLETAEDPRRLLVSGVSIALMSGVLISFIIFTRAKH
jgi:uncharacterized membrane protein YqhA